MGNKQHNSPGCLNRSSSLFFRIGLEGHRGRSEGVRIARGNIVLVQDAAGSDMDREILIDLRTVLSQLCYRMDHNGTAALR